MKVGESKVISKFSDVRTIAKYRRCYPRNPSTYLCSASIVRGLSLIAMSQPRAPATAGLGLQLANITIEPLPLTPYRPWLYLPDERRYQVFDYIAAAAPLGEGYEDECRFYPLSMVLKWLRINFEPYGKMNVFVDMLVLIPFLDTFFLSDGPLKNFGKGHSLSPRQTSVLCPLPYIEATVGLKSQSTSSVDIQVKKTFRTQLDLLLG
jgi:hypothetical protein